MKKLAIYLLLIINFNLNASNRSIEIGAFETVKLNYEEFIEYNVKIKNTSSKEIKVSVHEMESGKQVKGFGLPSRNHAVVQVEEGRELQIKNYSDKKIVVELKFVERKMTAANLTTPAIRFTLRNSSPNSIPLVIPNVMNPNLSPFSNSGVSLKIGQEVLFKYKGRKRVLFVVTDEIKEGDKIEVSALMKERIDEIESK